MNKNLLYQLAFNLIVAEESKKVIMLGGLEKKEFSLDEIRQFPQPRQGKWLESGQQDVVWSFRLPTGHIAFITKIGLNPVRKGDYYFYKGARLVDAPNSTRVYGTIDKPSEFDIGLNVSYDDIIFKGKNDDDQKGYFEVLCQGYYIKLDLVDEFFALLGRGNIEVKP